MCKLVIGIQKNKKKEFKEMIQSQYSSLRDQLDGIGALIVNAKNEIIILRSVDDYSDVFNKIDNLIDNAKVVTIHTRTGTSGSKKIENVHFFENDGIAFAHNGFVEKYHSFSGFGLRDNDYWGDKMYNSIEDCNGCNTANDGVCKIHARMFQKSQDIVSRPVVSEDCDSLQFLQNIKKPLTPASIESQASEDGFSGMGLVVDKKTGKFILLVKKDCFVTYSNDFGIFTSYEPIKKVKKIKKDAIFGVDTIIGSSQITIKSPTRKLCYGAYALEIPR